MTAILTEARAIPTAKRNDRDQIILPYYKGDIEVHHYALNEDEDLEIIFRHKEYFSVEYKTTFTLDELHNSIISHGDHPYQIDDGFVAEVDERDFDITVEELLESGNIRDIDVLRLLKDHTSAHEYDKWTKEQFMNAPFLHGIAHFEFCKARVPHNLQAPYMRGYMVDMLCGIEEGDALLV